MKKLLLSTVIIVIVLIFGFLYNKEPELLDEYKTEHVKLSIVPKAKKFEYVFQRNSLEELNVVYRFLDEAMFKGAITKHKASPVQLTGDELVATVDASRIPMIEYYSTFANNRNENIDNNYRLPFEKDIVVRVDQSNKIKKGWLRKGKRTHTDFKSNAVDFTVAEGSNIVVARSGLVVYSMNTSPVKYCKLPQCIDYSNNIIIRHEDGSVAIYAHLKENTIPHKIGDYVGEGSYLGQVGCSGYCKGAHLHFEVQYLSNDWLETLPINFKNSKDQILDITESNYIKY